VPETGNVPPSYFDRLLVELDVIEQLSLAVLDQSSIKNIDLWVPETRPTAADLLLHRWPHPCGVPEAGPSS
jgi:hypothetical protein